MQAWAVLSGAGEVRLRRAGRTHRIVLLRDVADVRHLQAQEPGARLVQ